MLNIRTLIHFGRAIDSILGARQLARAPEMHFSATRCFQSVIFHVLKVEENSNFFLFLSAILALRSARQAIYQNDCPKV